MEGSGDKSDWLAVIFDCVMKGRGRGEGNSNEAETGGMKEKLLVERAGKVETQDGALLMKISQRRGK